MIAVQGPDARARLATVAPGAAPVARFAVAAFEWEGTPCLVAGTGYTGEDGVECAVPAAARVALVGRAGRRRRAGRPGARDTLRLEAGLPLHGHELGPGITPLQAGLGWVVGWDKGSFRGRAALEAERRHGPAPPAGRAWPPRGASRRGRGPRCSTGGAPGRHGHQRQLLPMLGHGIALALLDTGVGRRLRGRRPPSPSSSGGDPLAGHGGDDPVRARRAVRGRGPHRPTDAA